MPNAQRRIVNVTRCLALVSAGAHRQSAVNDRGTEEAVAVITDAPAVVNAKYAAANLSLGLRETWIPGDVLEYAAHGVGSVDCALRTAQQFDAFDVIRHQFELIRALPGQIRARADGGIVNDR